jgi:hypothetical protein
MYLRVHKTVFESFWELVLKKKSKRVTGSKLRINELTKGNLPASNYEFTN